MDAPEPLTPVDESWQTALAVVAHPDDMEFGASAAVARWTGQGKRVVYCMVTSGEAGIDGMDPQECGDVRTAEQIESGRIVGVDTVEFLGLPDGILEYGVPLRRAIAAVVRKHRPDMVITNNFRDSWGGRGNCSRSSVPLRIQWIWRTVEFPSPLHTCGLQARLHARQSGSVGAHGGPECSSHSCGAAVRCWMCALPSQCSRQRRSSA